MIKAEEKDVDSVATTKVNHISYSPDTYITAVFLGMSIANEVKHQLKAPLKIINMTMNQWLVLKTVFLKRADTPTNVANMLNTSTAAVTRYVDILVLNDLIKREHQDEDRRVIQLILTDKGLEIAENIIKSYEGILDNLESRLMQEEFTMWQTVKVSLH